jgi:hypothetical protein
MFFPSAVPATRKAVYTRLKASVMNRLSGTPDRFSDMTILNREGRQACRVGCRAVLCCQQNTSNVLGAPALWGRIHRLFLATGESNGLQGWLSSCMRYQPYSWSVGSYFPVCRLRLRIRVGVQRAVEALTGFSFESAVPVPPPFFLAAH